MLRYLLLPAGLIAVLSVAAGPARADAAQPATPALDASSKAAILHFHLDVDGKKTASRDEVAAAGHAPPSYDRKTDRAKYTKSTKIAGGLTFDTSATGIETVATGKAATATGIAVTASATAASFTGTLSNASGKLMTITTGKITSGASFTQTKAGARSTKGDAKLVKVKIDAPKLGISKTFTGTPKPNQVLYRDKERSIVIFLNRQTKTKVDDKDAGLAVDAVDIQFADAQVGGDTISGAIAIGPTSTR